MGELIKMKIIAFSDGTFRGALENKTITLQINPSSLKLSKGIKYSEDNIEGKSEQDIKFEKHKNSTLSFDFVLDDTGIISMPKQSISNMVDSLEQVVYNINSETHETNYLQVNWGSFLFNGRMTSLNYDYTLFRPDGSPLRVKVSVSIDGYMNKLMESKMVGRQSSDLSRIVTVKAGKSLALLCHQIYGDAGYCSDIAAYNNLSDFRSIKTGTQLMFPPISHGEISK